MTEHTEKISVVTVSYYTGPILFTMIASVLKQPMLKELVLVNNGNSLPVYHQLLALEEQEPRLKLMSGHGNVGFASGCNLGAKEATGDYIFILNPDCHVEEGLFATMLAESEKQPRPHIISCRVLDDDGKEQSGSRRDILTPWSAFVEVFGLYRIAPNHPYFRRFKWHEESVPADTIEVPAVSGAVMLMPREDYWRVGGFDEDYFLHVEDIDLCMRLRRAGGRIFFTPHAYVRHKGGTSAAPSFIVELHKTRSFVKYFFKNFSDTYPRFFLYVVAAATWLRFWAQRIILLCTPQKKT